MRELRHEAAVIGDLKPKIGLMLRNYSSDRERQLRARLKTQSDAPYLLPEQAGSPSRP